MSLVADADVSGRAVAWTFMHLWRVDDGVIVEHWACGDDTGLLEQLK
ncbi:MAG TPA: ester cyclase [Frankiaceae bacterium]|jgi:lactoylglutathione lyase|nr:ester cyclase [Frankiaceae bacterium]